MQQITFEELTPNLTQEEWAVLNENIEYTEARRKAASVLRYLKKHILLNEGSWSKSIANIYAMYNRYHKYISTGQLKNIINRLKDLGLIVISVCKKRNVYTMPVAEKMAEKVADNENITPKENQDIQEDLEKPRSSFLDNKSILYTNNKKSNNILSILKKAYKGIKPSLIATKKQLRDIVQATLVAKGISGNNAFHKAIQYLVFKKIRYSNQKISLLGAVSYIEKVIDDRIEAYNNNLVNVPSFITNAQNLRFNDFPQRTYDYNDLEKKLLGWN